MRKVASTVILVILVFTNFGFSAFEVGKVELDDPIYEEEEEKEPEKETIIKRVYYDNDDEIEDLEDEIEDLEDENRDLEDELEDLEDRIKKLENSVGNTRVQQSVPYEGMLSDSAKVSINHRETVYSSKIESYTSRISKASLSLVNSGIQTTEVYLGDLKIRKMDIIDVKNEDLAYNQFVTIENKYNDKDILEKAIIGRWTIYE